MSKELNLSMKKLDRENRRIILKIEQYMETRYINEIACEDILSDIVGMALECQERGEPFSEAIGGDYEAYPEFFIPGYFKTSPQFTMQMIYDIQVTVHSGSTVSLDGKDVTAFNFVVRYKIHQNNGTFRTGVHSDSSVPQVYQLVRGENEEYKIFDILEVISSQ